MRETSHARLRKQGNLRRRVDTRQPSSHCERRPQSTPSGFINLRACLLDHRGDLICLSASIIFATTIVLIMELMR